jgi:transposase
MARPFKFSKKELERALELRDNHKNEREARAAACFILMAESRLSREEAARAFGIASKTASDDIDRIRSPDLTPKGIWGGGHNHLMTIEEETQFLEEFKNKAIDGELPTMPELHAEYNKRVGKNTPKSTFYRMLKRHEWRKVLPDTKHPKSDPEIQEDFKKKHSKYKWISS